MTRSVHVVLPNDIDDPATPSGGNAYDRRVCDGLAAAGWTVREHAVRGAWPRPTGADRAALAARARRRCRTAPSCWSTAWSPPPCRTSSRRRRTPAAAGGAGAHAAGRRDRRQAGASAGRGRRAWSPRATGAGDPLVEPYGLPADRVYAAPPGVDAAPRRRARRRRRSRCCASPPSPRTRDTTCWSTRWPRSRDRPWTCVCVGSLDRDPAFADAVRRTARTRGHRRPGRVRRPAHRRRPRRRYAAADLLVLPSRGETYGMVVTEALARGVPVLATAVGGVPEALGRVDRRRLPGLLVPPGDPAALAAALRRWLADADLRDRLRKNALVRRTTLTGWAATRSSSRTPCPRSPHTRARVDD